MSEARSLNITHCVETLHRGGLEHVVLDLAQAQQAHGHRCQVVCLFDEGLLAPRLREAGVPVHACDKRGGLDLRALARMRGHIRAHATEVLHTHNVSAHYYAVASTLGSRPRVTINTRHGMGAQHPADRREQLYRYCMPRTDRVVAVCDMARHRLEAHRGIDARKLEVVYNGIDFGVYVARSEPARERLLERMGLPPGTRLLGFVGRLNALKDPATLMRAFAALHARQPDTALLMIGDGGLRDSLERQVAELGIQSAVRFLGDREDVPALLSALDVFVMASISEGFSIALLEACASGVPIVATDVGGNPEIVRHDVNGLLVPPEQPETLAAAVAELLNAPERAQRMGQAGRAWVREHATLEAMVSNYARIYAACR